MTESERTSTLSLLWTVLLSVYECACRQRPVPPACVFGILGHLLVSSMLPLRELSASIAVKGSKGFIWLCEQMCRERQGEKQESESSPDCFQLLFIIYFSDLDSEILTVFISVLSHTGWLTCVVQIWNPQIHHLLFCRFHKHCRLIHHYYLPTMDLSCSSSAGSVCRNQLIAIFKKCTNQYFYMNIHLDYNAYIMCTWQVVAICP